MEMIDKNTTDNTAIVRVNDGDMGKTPFSFEFGPHWVHEGGYPDRFFGGDEHWVTAVQFGDDWPHVTFRFTGESVKLYGHKMSAGAMADVTVNGVPAGRINFYSPDRREKTLLWESGTLPFGDYTVVVQLIPESDPAAGDAHEAAVDYAEVVTSSVLPVTGIAAERGDLIMEPGLVCTFGYTLLPDYATETPVVTVTPTDPVVLDAALCGQRVTVRALTPGVSSVVLRTDTGVEKVVSVTVRKARIGLLSGMAGSCGHHARQDMYWDKLRNWDPARRALSVTVWRRDRGAVKLELITGTRDVPGVTVTASPLINADGCPFKGTVRCGFVRDTLAYDTNRPIPDVITRDTCTDIPAQSLGSVWTDIESDETAVAGEYTGVLTVTNGLTDERIDFPLTVTVIGLTLPVERPELELWQYPYSSNRYYSGLSTADYFPDGRAGMYASRIVTDGRLGEGLRSQVGLYARAGGKSLTATIVEDPWNSQTPDPYPSMVKWIRTENGHFTFAYDDFDKWVDFNADCGVDGRILCYSMSGWGSGITYRDTVTGEVTVECPAPDSERWRAVWTEFLRDFMAHTTEKGWFDRIYLAMDERPAPMVEGVLDLVESVRNADGACFRTALAVYTFDTAYLFDRVTDLSLAYYMDPARIGPIIAHRRALGLVTTLYTCGPQYNALNNPPYEGAYTLWFCDRMGADGFLRWAQDAFNDAPLITSYHLPFAAGDIYLYYPDAKDAAHPAAQSSPRFETLAQSARDVAKLRYLRAAAPELLTAVDEAQRRLTGHGDLETPVTELRRLLDEAAEACARETREH